MIKISVILTTYNSEKFIIRTINSILNQEGVNEIFTIELIVVDDCSLDRTTEALRNLNIEYKSTLKNSGGPNAGRNIGLSFVTGDFICIADHDDEWKPHKIKLLLSVSGMAPIITSGYTLVDMVNNKRIEKVRKTDNAYTFFDKNETFLKKLVKSQNCQQTYIGSLMYSSTLKHIKFEEEYGMSDYDFGLGLLENNCSVEVTASLYTRNVSADNLSLAESYRINDYNKNLKIAEKYRTKYPREAKIFVQKTNGNLARYYYLLGNMKQARKYFLKSGLSVKTILYFITTFVGSDLVKKKFNVFG